MTQASQALIRELGRGRARALARLGGVALLACCLLLALVAVPAGAATTSVSSFAKSGTDASTGSTATGAGASGSTAAGHAIDWVLRYRNLTGAAAQVGITDPITGNQAFVPGSLRTPPGFSPRWSTNGGVTYATSEPASGVDAVGASGVSVASSTGADASANEPTITSIFAGEDGFEPLFIGGDVYNLTRARVAGSADPVIDCHSQTIPGARCSGYPASYVSQTAGAPLGTGGDTLDTSAQPFAAVDSATGKIYFPAGVAGSTSIGVACIDVSTGTSCGYTRLGDGPTANTVTPGDEAVQISGGAVIGTRMYLISAAPGVPIYCFDYSTGAACPGYPVDTDPSYTSIDVSDIGTALSDVQTFDGRYVFGTVWRNSGTRDLVCLDASTGTACPGFPELSYTTLTSLTLRAQVLAPHESTAGQQTGICAETASPGTSAPFACFGMTGGSLGPAPWGQLVAGDDVGYQQQGGVLALGARLYLPYANEATGEATYACWDFSSGAPCAGFVVASSHSLVQPYTLRQDPDHPDCVWEMGHNGYFETFSATFGGIGCYEGSAAVALTPAASYCDGKGGHVTGWRELALDGVSASDYDAVSVSITDANGNPVPGWTDRIFTSSQLPIDISSIPYSGSTTTLHVTVAIVWGDNTAVPVTLAVTFNGDPVQVCFETIVGTGACSAATSITNAATAVTDADDLSDKPVGNGSGTATFLEAADPSACSAPPTPPSADVSIHKRALDRPLVAGGDERYRLLVHNHGPDAARDVVVNDRLPHGESFASASHGCTHAKRTVTCRLGTLAPGVSRTLTIVVHVTRSLRHAVANTATVTASTHDPNHRNNSSTARVAIEPRLGLTKASSRRTIDAGQTVSFTITVSNPSGQTVHRVRTCDALPIGLTYLRARPRPRLSDGRYCWTTRTLGAHRRRVYTLKARSLTGAGGTLVNHATATARDALPARASARVRVIVAPPKPGGGVTG